MLLGAAAGLVLWTWDMRKKNERKKSMTLQLLKAPMYRERPGLEISQIASKIGSGHTK